MRKPITDFEHISTQDFVAAAAKRWGYRAVRNGIGETRIYGDMRGASASINLVFASKNGSKRTMQVCIYQKGHGFTDEPIHVFHSASFDNVMSGCADYLSAGGNSVAKIMRRTCT